MQGACESASMTEVRAVAARSGVGPRYSEWPAPGPNSVPLPPASGRSSFLVPTLSHSSAPLLSGKRTLAHSRTCSGTWG